MNTDNKGDPLAAYGGSRMETQPRLLLPKTCQSAPIKTSQIVQSVNPLVGL